MQEVNKIPEGFVVEDEDDAKVNEAIEDFEEGINKKEEDSEDDDDDEMFEPVSEEVPGKKAVEETSDEE